MTEYVLMYYISTYSVMRRPRTIQPGEKPMNRTTSVTREIHKSIRGRVLALIPILALALGLGLMTAAPSSASTAASTAASVQSLDFASAAVPAGGTGNFYKTASCQPPYAGSTAATGYVSNYDVHNYTDQEVHTSSKGGYMTGLWWKPLATYVNGVKVGTPEAYRIISDIHASVTVEFVWSWSFKNVSCKAYISRG